MKDLFAELYTKVLNFFQTEKSDNSKETATNRLKLVLMHDRTKLDPLTLENMRQELVDVISKYVIIEKELLELNLEGEGDSIALMLNIPVVRAKTEEELELDKLAKDQTTEDETANDENSETAEQSEEIDEALEAEKAEEAEETVEIDEDDSDTKTESEENLSEELEASPEESENTCSTDTETQQVKSSAKNKKK